MPLPFHASRWQFREAPEQLDANLVKAAKGSELLARLLYQRGFIAPESIAAFLSVPEGTYTPCPGTELPDASAALERIKAAIAKQEPILVFGDFDVDGITGTSIWVEALTALGAKVTYYLPDRATEGHGLNSAALCRLVSSRKLKLVITTDTGIANFNEISLLKGLGVDTIVTDHHELPDNLPPSVANVNPQRYEEAGHPLANLSGAGVAYKLAEALLQDCLPHEEATLHCEALLDLTATGLVADMVPLIDDNRYLVYNGLRVLKQRQRVGFRAILEQAGVAPEAALDASTIGFTIAPRLNALGRLANATEAVELLTTRDTERASKLAAHLEQLNRKRQDLCEQTFLEAEQHLNQTGGLDGRKAIILASPSWNPGIIGIVATRLIERYRVPTFLMVSDENANTARCSARSIPGFHLTEHLDTLSEYFLNYGGHAGAAGFSLPLDKLGSFKSALWKRAAENISDEMLLPLVTVDAILQANQLGEGLLQLLEWMAPFGMGNPEPLFGLKGFYVSAQRSLGEAGKHLKLILTPKPGQHHDPIETLWWNAGVTTRLETKQAYDFVVSIVRNSYERGPAYQLVLKEVKPNGAVVQSLSDETSAFAEKQRPATKGIELAITNNAVAAVMDAKEGPRWIDHRNRKALTQFVGQLMLPAQQGRQLRIFHEGKAPDLPLINADWLVDRGRVSPCQELIFWDVPPHPSILQQALQQAQPEVIHWVGGKYETTPLRLQEGLFIKGIWLSLKQALPSEQALDLPISRLAARFASSQEAVLLVLYYLESCGRLEISTPASSTEPQVRLRLLRQSGEEPLPPAPASLSVLLASVLDQVSHYRSWLLKASLQELKQHAMQPAYWATSQQTSVNRPGLAQAALTAV